MTTKFYNLSIDSPDFIEEHQPRHVIPFDTVAGGFGFEVEERPQDCVDKFTNVIVYKDDVYISTSLFSTLTGARARDNQHRLTMGRTRFFRLEDHFDDIYSHIEYERRSDRERAVQKRNRAIFEYLIDIL